MKDLPPPTPTTSPPRPDEEAELPLMHPVRVAIMAAVANAYSVGIELIAIPYVYSMETAADKSSDGISRAVSHTHIHVFVFVVIFQPCCHVTSVGHPIVSHDG